MFLGELESCVSASSTAKVPTVPDCRRCRKDSFDLAAREPDGIIGVSRKESSELEPAIECHESNVRTVISRIGASYKKATSRPPISSVVAVPIVLMTSLVADSFCSTSISCSLLSSIMLEAPTSTTHYEHKRLQHFMSQVQLLCS